MNTTTQTPSTVRVENTDIPLIIYQGKATLTTELLATLYGTDSIRIQQNYLRNEARFESGKHFFKLEGDELQSLRLSLSESQISSKTRSLMLWTERGSARLVQ